MHYHGRDLLWERIVWLPSRRPLRARLDGRRLDLTTKLRRRTTYTAGLARLRDPLPATASERPATPGLLDQLTVWLSKQRPIRRLFGEAWVLMDRIHDADDSGERLFSYLRTRRRKINSWFVVERGTPDYRRLRRRGLPPGRSARVAAPGSC